MSASRLIQNAQVVLPDGIRTSDVAIADGRIDCISALGECLTTGGFDQVIDATGLVLLPGVVDAHVHFRIPGGAHKEDWDSASRAALAGGVTTVLDMPNTDPPTIDRAALDAKRAEVSAQARVHYGFYMGATRDNLAEVTGAENIAALKIYMGSSTGGLLVHEQEPLERIFAEFPGLIAVHAEDEQIIQENSLLYQDDPLPTVHPKIRSVLSAKRATERAIFLAQRHQRQLHICHMSTREELALVRAASDPQITCEVTPHHLTLTTDALNTLGTLAKMNPPLRSQDDCDALWQGLAAGEVTCVATDHAPHTLKEKAGGYWSAPSGVPGVQHLLPILLDGVRRGVLDLSRVAQVASEWPARLFNMQGKGQITIGADADLVLVDMDQTRTVTSRDGYSKCGWTPYDGMELTGWPVMTLLDGEVVYDRGEFGPVVKGREVRFG